MKRSLSRHVTAVFLLLAPPGTPQNLRATSISDTSITIQWESVNCSDCNGTITGYNVTYGKASEVQRSMTFMSDNSFTAVGLLFDTLYIFQVQAFSIGYGHGESASIAVTTSSLQGRLLIACYSI